MEEHQAEDNDAEWVKRCRSREIEGGALQYGNQAAGRRGSTTTTPGFTRAKAVHDYSKFRTQREAVKG